MKMSDAIRILQPPKNVVVALDDFFKYCNHPEPLLRESCVGEIGKWFSKAHKEFSERLEIYNTAVLHQNEHLEKAESLTLSVGHKQEMCERWFLMGYCESIKDSLGVTPELVEAYNAFCETIHTLRESIRSRR
jgi:hypothetical protein